MFCFRAKMYWTGHWSRLLSHINTTSNCTLLLAEHCPKLLWRVQRGLERSPWAAAAKAHWRKMTEAAEWPGTKMMTSLVREMNSCGGRQRRRRQKNAVRQKTQLCMLVFQYRTMVNLCPAAPCEPQRSPPWSSWWSSLVSVTTSVWAWASSPSARLVPSQASSLGSLRWTDSTLSAAGTHVTSCTAKCLLAAEVSF